MTNQLTEQITFLKLKANLLDKPVYEPLFSTYASLTYGTASSFSSSKGADIYKKTIQAEIRRTTNLKNLSLDNLFFTQKNITYKVTSCFYESEKNGYLKFSAESVA